MLDHVFTDAIGSLRDALEQALLERQAFEERFQSDILLGDLTWATSYSLPGEGVPARVQADITLDWPTWSQTAYRLWYISEPVTDPPHIVVSVAFRVQRLRFIPDPRAVLAVIPLVSPQVGATALDRSAPKVETVFDTSLKHQEHAFEITFEGLYELSESALADGTQLDQHFGTLGSWIASTLVKLGDLKLSFLDPEPIN